MRSFLFALGICAATVMTGTQAEAQNYPWCAFLTMGDDGGATNCGFVSYEQCMATVRGMGGFCERNTQYVPPAGPRRARKY